MDLLFEYEERVGNGQQGNIIFFEDEKVSVLNTDVTTIDTINGTIKLENNTSSFQSKINIFDKITRPEFFKFITLDGFGAIGSYREGDIVKRHYVLVHEYDEDIGDYLVNGKIKIDDTSPISSFDLELYNLKNHHEFFREENTPQFKQRLQPNRKINIIFSLGNSEEVSFNQFFIDTVKHDVKTGKVQIQGRNKIGKFLKEQTFNANSLYSADLLTKHIEDILIFGGYEKKDIKILKSTKKGTFEFKAEQSLLDGIKEVMKVLDEKAYIKFYDDKLEITNTIQNDVLTIDREKEIFSRVITADDRNSYSFVCVKTEDGKESITQEVSNLSSWIVPRHKTLYKKVPNGLSREDIKKHAILIATNIARDGHVQDIRTKFKLEAKPSDILKITSDIMTDSEQGRIKSVSHSFGKNGYFTDIRTDTGESIGERKMIEILERVLDKKTGTYKQDTQGTQGQ